MILQAAATNWSPHFFAAWDLSHESWRYYLGASLWEGEGFSEKLRPGAASQSLGKLGRTGEGGPRSEKKNDDARFSRGKNESAEIQIQMTLH